MALITVVILGLVFSILGISLFAMTGYEYGQVSYRDQSASAFWLAEAAIEHMKGEVFRQLQWSVGFDSIPKGEGWYSLSITDTTFDDEPAKYIYSQGFARRPGGGYVERDIEMFADIGPAGFEYALFSMNDIVGRGNAGVCGLVHGNDDVDDGGSSLEQLGDSCRGGGDHISEGFTVYPPGMRTQPRYYDRTTYYYVVSHPLGPLAVPRRAWIMRPDTAGTYTIRGGIKVSRDLRPTIPGSQEDSIPVTYGLVGGQLRMNCSFMAPAAINAMFDLETGRCWRDTLLSPPDLYVVVNFGEYLTVAGVPTPAPYRTNLNIDDGPAYPAPIRSSVFNTRYIEASDDTTIAELTDTANWTGGNTTMAHLRCIPENGIALLIHDISMSGPAQIEIGTPTRPVVFYLTGSIIGSFNANGNIYGTTIVLGTINRLAGTVAFHYDGGYQEDLPDYLSPFWQNPSGHVDVLLWREVPPKYSS